MSLPTGQPTEFTVARVEIKKTLPAKDGNKPATIYKLGLVDTSGDKGWAELFVRDGQTPPGEGTKETLILTQPDNPNWALKAARPGARGGGRPAGRSPADTAAIQRQHSQEMALRALAIAYGDNGIPSGDSPAVREPFREALKDWTDWFEADIANGGKAK